MDGQEVFEDPSKNEVAPEDTRLVIFQTLTLKISEIDDVATKKFNRVSDIYI